VTTALIPLILAVPMLGAALLAGTQRLHHRLLAEGIALAAATGATVLCALVLRMAIDHGELVYWFGGWRPRHGVALGIAFTIDPFGAGLATFAGLLTISALVFSWRHFDSVGHAFPALLLVFMAALTGFCLSGDLFDMFVFFELMTVVAIALTAHRSDQRAPLQGALNFGICNAIGGFLVLFGIALLYGRTGALNLAQIGVALRAAHGHGDALVIVAFGLIASGFFVKAAIIPFHFWLADAYTSAPTPVCILFAGVMSEMGLYGLGRVYWTVFAGPLGAHAATLRLILVVLGSVTAVGGGVMCLLQHLPKRLLAFATIGSMGLFLIGFGLLDVRALGGVAVFVVGDGLLKAGLFVCVGILQHRRVAAGSLRVRGLGRGLRFTGPLFALGALGLAAMPGFGTFLGRSLIESAASSRPGYAWVPYVMSAAEILIGGSVLAAWARVFLGWGPDDRDERLGGESAEEGEELEVSSARTPAVLFVPALALVLGGIATGVVPGVTRLALAGAARFVDTRRFAAAVLSGHTAAVRGPVASGPSIEEILIALGLTGLTALVGLTVIAPRRLPFGPAAVQTLSHRVARRLHELHSGHPGDDVAWLVTGAAVVCGALVLTLG
jgi:multicomponent Na+:H+ antiporter subunit D